MKIAKEQFELLPSVGGMAVGILNPDLSNFLLTAGIHNHNNNHFLRLNHLMLSSHCLTVLVQCELQCAWVTLQRGKWLE